MPHVNPDILKWARTTAGLSLAQAAKGILNDTHGKTGADRLAELESGNGQPTRVILGKMATKYNRPVTVFYLEKPPASSERGEDFRTISQPVDSVLDADLNALLRKIKASQQIVRDLLEDEDEEEKPLNFIGSVTIENKPQDVADNIVATIGFDINQFRSYRRVSRAFDYLRDKVQDAGIFVILAGGLSTHRTNIPPEIFRGFVIADDIAPFIVINDGDAVSARSFTLLHELAHLWLGSTGISGSLNVQSDNVVERFCNQVAALILLAQEELDELKTVQTTTLDEIADMISKFAEDRNISRSMVVYKLFLDKQITSAVWQRLSDKFYEEWRESVRRQKDKDGRTPGGPSYYVVRRSKLGRELTALASRAMSSGSLTPSKASIVLLGVKPGNVFELVSSARPKGNG